MFSENENSKSILELTNDEARQYFLKQESYCNFDLPRYINFQELLNGVDEVLKGKNLSDFSKEIPRNYDDINYKILNNKDGKYAWRPLQLINPALYVSLVHKLTTQENWKHLKARFAKFSNNPKIECLSIPRESLSENTDKAEQISNWWYQIEQSSIEIGLEYSCLTHTDLTDCYGSIYTHSIAWAVHGKNVAKDSRNVNGLIGNQIDKHLRDMSHGQTNGIPQGSTLMDFIAELVLGYADLKLGKRLKREEIKNYTILRYRDDYRIFSNSPIVNHSIVKCLTEIMIELGLKLNADKTYVPANVIKGSIKTDKLYWLKQKQTAKNLQKHLLIIHDLSLQFPNSGSLSRAMKGFYNKLEKQSKINVDIVPLLSIVTDIAHKNPRTYPYSIAIISLILNFEADNSKKSEHFKKVINRFEDIPNTGHFDIWFQRVALGIRYDISFNEDICKLVNGENIDLWNLSWLEGKLKKKIEDSSIVDTEEIEKQPETITKDEVNLFKFEFYSGG